MDNNPHRLKDAVIQPLLNPPFIRTSTDRNSNPQSDSPNKTMLEISHDATEECLLSDDRNET